MAAITKRLLHLRPNLHSYARPHPYLIHHFSSSSDRDPLPDIPQPEPSPDAKTRPSFSSSFNDVKASLQQRPPPQNRRQAPPSRADSTEEIRRNLSQFRIRSAAPPPSSSGDQYVSLQELYERNVSPKPEGSANPSGFNSGEKRSFDTIRASLSQLNPTGANDSGGKLSDRWSLSRFTENLKLKANQNANQDSTVSIGGSQNFIPSFLRKEAMGKGDSSLGSMGFGMMYNHVDLGKKLKKLRPENRKGKWFSLQEFSDRLANLRAAEEKESEARLGVSMKYLKDGLKQSAQEKARKPPVHIASLGSLGGTKSYETSPPKNHLVEKYFHPDNMSSAEKLKLELQKVRDEFKMSESDCGSARVQVAQLTTKIKHLSTVLRKKDKHSRRGLQAMVQRRKKLLKYLRRTDWDSYCLVLSKLGLRDNPDIKA